MRFRDDEAWKRNDASLLGFDPTFAREITGFPNIPVDGYGSLFGGGSNAQSAHFAQSFNSTGRTMPKSSWDSERSEDGS